MSTINSRNRRARAQPHGFVASLTPEGQINKVIADMNNLKDGHDLCKWSASARKELTPFLTITFQVGDRPAPYVRVPKLALIVASPVVRAHFVKNPTSTKAKFTYADVSLEAVHNIAKWLKDVCMVPQFPEIPVPNDTYDALKLRLTANTLGMERYVGHIDACYIDGVANRVPSLQEITQVVDNTRGEDDAILIALANRLSYLCRYHKVSKAEEIAYAELLADEKYGRLLAAVVEDEVKKMAKRTPIEV